MDGRERRDTEKTEADKLSTYPVRARRLQRSIGVGDKLAEVEAAKDAGVAASLRADALLPPNLRTSQNKKDNEIEAKRNVVRQVQPNNQYQTSQAMVHESSMAEHTNNTNSNATNLCQDRAQVAFHRGAVDTGVALPLRIGRGEEPQQAGHAVHRARVWPPLRPFGQPRARG